MTPTEYIKLAQKTANEETDNMNHYIIGLTCETGEVAHLHKADIIYGRPYDREEMVLEMSDLCWYLANMIRLLDSSWEELWEKNIEKLMKRYPDGFTKEAAQAKEAAKRGEG